MTKSDSGQESSGDIVYCIVAFLLRLSSAFCALGVAFRLFLRAHLSSGDRVVVVIVLSVMSVNSSPLDPSGSGIGVVLA